MAKKEDKAVEIKPVSCFTIKEFDQVKEYIEAGLPDIINVTDYKLMAAFNMFLDGMPFLEISRSLDLKKVQIMYLTHKYGWHERRLEFLDEFEREMKERVLEEKIRSQGFLLKALYVQRRRLNKKFDHYLSTGKDDPLHPLDMNEEVAVYVKIIKAVSELDIKGLAKDNNNKPLIGLNAGEGIDIKQSADGTLQVTPRQKSNAEMLAELARLKEEQKKDSEKNKP